MEAFAFPKAGNDWFSRIFGFKETSYEVVKKWLQVSGTKMRSLANQNSFEIGNFETPSLKDLIFRVNNHSRVDELRKKDGLRLCVKTGDVSVQLSLPENRHATFQAASQFNCLEFVGPRVTPEEGITGYAFDRTQGPACSIACGPATAFRNYFVKIPGGEGFQEGQTKDLMINCLSDVSDAIGNSPEGRYFRNTGGYTLASDSGLEKMNIWLQERSHEEMEELRSLLRIGVHSDIQVTSSHWGKRLIPPDTVHLVTQVFGSACSVAYSGNRRTLWKPLASNIVLEASYHATLWASIENALNHLDDHDLPPEKRSRARVFLTYLGGGVFGNSMGWIADAIQSACNEVKDFNIEVTLVNYDSHIDQRIQSLLNQFN